jgi:hypothetical protein
MFFFILVDEFHYVKYTYKKSLRNINNMIVLFIVALEMNQIIGLVKIIKINVNIEPKMTICYQI